MRFERHYTREDAERLFDGDFNLPDVFMFGVANSGYQTEGGFNGPGEPLNNWYYLENSQKVERSGEAIRSWTEYPGDVDLAAGIDLNAFRLGVEWARVQPCVSPGAPKAPPYDTSAIEGYTRMIAAVMRAGMEPVVTLHHFTHPLWLGIDYWLDGECVELFRSYVREFADRVNGSLVREHGLHPVRLWITLNEPNILAVGAYLVRYMPHGKTGIRATARALSNMIAAHCAAYDCLYGLYDEKGWPAPGVTYNTAQTCVYEFDKVVADLLTARRNGVARGDLGGYLEEGRASWYREIALCPVAQRPPRYAALIEELVVRAAGLLHDLSNFDSALDAIYGSPEPEKMDFLAVDFYDPFLRNLVKVPGLADLRHRGLKPYHDHWEQVLNPRAMYHFLKAACINGEGLPAVILESGMATRVSGGRAAPRRDGATRDRFLRHYLFEAMRAVKDGLPLAGYFYWTLVDNYEWGSYESRFGLYTVDRETGTARRPVDAWGVDAGGTYREIVSALRSGDRERMVEAFAGEGR